ncbi:hypothetical protein KIW84_056750 [Lathyrus oleraceus]|uniref:Uncharacterized protein n=1 Tax=Pisum sativum TaxID=3888 RepID=A0A9D4X424_PEA|nr:hypothetical protein KIW84_056750 [Pisum sativum]
MIGPKSPINVSTIRRLQHNLPTRATQQDQKDNQAGNKEEPQGNEDVNQDVPDNKYGILVTEFPTQRKDEQVTLVNSEVNNKLVQTSDYETIAEENVQDIFFTMMRKVGGKRIQVDVTHAHMDDVSLHFEISVKKWKSKVLSINETMPKEKRIEEEEETTYEDGEELF